jgi:hypothetical protein
MLCHDEYKWMHACTGPTQSQPVLAQNFLHKRPDPLPHARARSRRLLHRLAHRVPARLLREHDAKALKVAERAAFLDRGALLRPRRLLPLLERARLLELALDH